MKRYPKIIVMMVVAIIVNIIIVAVAKPPKAMFMQIELELAANNNNIYTIAYNQSKVEAEYNGNGNAQKLVFNIPVENNKVNLELGRDIDTIRLDRAKLSFMKQEIDLLSIIAKDSNVKNDIGKLEQVDTGIQIQVVGENPYITLNIPSSNFDKLILRKTIEFKLALCVMSTILIVVMFMLNKVIKKLLFELNNNRRIIWDLSKNDFKTKYAGSYLGITWAFVQPIITVLVYWFVFQVGFKSIPIEGFPYVLWLISGIVPWFFFNDAVQNAMNSLMEYSYLVKKVVFKISILPIVKIMSALFVHIFFVSFMLLLFALYGYKPDLYTLQIIYYSGCLFVLVLGISYITSSIVVFFRDLGQIVSICLQVGMWMTPILWDINTLSNNKYQTILKLNPVYYIVSGYRDSLINKVWFWDRYNQTMYYWSVVVVIFAVGVVIYKRLKPHFADVL